MKPTQANPKTSTKACGPNKHAQPPNGPLDRSSRSLRPQRSFGAMCLSTLCLSGLAHAQAQAQTGATPSTPSLQLSPLIESGQINPNWRLVGLPTNNSTVPLSPMGVQNLDGEPSLQVLTDASYGTLVHNWRGAVPARLTWSWRLDQPLVGGQRPPDILKKSGDDAAIKICVMFDHALSRVPLWERSLLRLARTVSGEPLPAATLCYLWDSTYLAAAEGKNPYTARVRFVVLRGKNAPLTRWVSESVDVKADFIRLFGDELGPITEGAIPPVPEVSAVVIGADADNTGAQSQAWLRDLRWAP